MLQKGYTRFIAVCYPQIISHVCEGRDIAQAKQLMKLIQEDIERVEAIQMPPNEDARKEMFGNIKELYIISCRYAAVVSSFSPFSVSWYITTIYVRHMIYV